MSSFWICDCLVIPLNWLYYHFDSSRMKQDLSLIGFNLGVLLPPANEGYVFTPVYLFIREGGVCTQGVCIRGADPLPFHHIQLDMVNDRAVRILLECILVDFVLSCWTVVDDLSRILMYFKRCQTHEPIFEIVSRSGFFYKKLTFITYPTGFI